MSIKQYKICPVCKNFNDPKAIECISCATDLTNIKPVTKDKLKAASEDPEEKNKGSAKKGKRCSECGFINEPQARKCTKCGEDLSDVPVSAIEQSDLPGPGNTRKRYEIVSIDGQYSIDLPEDEQSFIIGRDAFLSEYLTEKLYVSRQQAAIAIDSDQFLIRSLSRTNPTFVNNQELEKGKEYAFPLGQEIGLGGTIIDGKRQSKAAYVALRIKK